MGVLELGRVGSRGGRLGRPVGSVGGMAGTERAETRRDLIAPVFSRSAGCQAAWGSLSGLDGGSGGSLAWSKAGASTRRVARESTEVVLARDRERLEMEEMWDISEEFEPRLECSCCVGLRGGKVGVGVGLGVSVGVGVCSAVVLREGSGGRPGRAGELSAAGVVVR